ARRQRRGAELEVVRTSEDRRTSSGECHLVIDREARFRQLREHTVATDPVVPEHIESRRRTEIEVLCAAHPNLCTRACWCRRALQSRKVWTRSIAMVVPRHLRLGSDNRRFGRFRSFDDDDVLGPLLRWLLPLVRR